MADTEPGKWPCRFNSWEQLSSVAIADTLFEMKSRAKTLQTPKEILPSARGDFSTVFRDINPLAIEDSILQTNLSLSGKTWQEAVQSVTGSKQDFLPEDWSLGKHLWETHENLGGVTKVVACLAEDQLSDDALINLEDHGSRKVGGRPIAKLHSALTDTERRLNTQLAVKYAALELEMDDLLAGLKIFRENNLDLRSESSAKQITSLEGASASPLPSGHAPPVDLDLILKGLGMD